MVQTVNEDKKVQAENMRLKKEIKALKKIIVELQNFIGGK